MKTISAPTKTKRARRKSRWIPGGLPRKPPTQEQIDELNRRWDEIASRLNGKLPPDLAINHDYYLHGLPKQQP